MMCTLRVHKSVSSEHTGVCKFSLSYMNLFDRSTFALCPHRKSFNHIFHDPSHPFLIGKR